MFFVVRASVIAILIFAATLAGFGIQSLLTTAYIADSKAMIGSVAGLDATLLALVLGLLIWTSHGQFTTHQSQMQTLVRSIVLLDLSFASYGPETEAGRRELFEVITRAKTRFWVTGARGARVLAHGDIAAEVIPMRKVFASLQPNTDEQRHHLEAARNLFGTILDTQITMIRSLVNPVPNLLLNVVVGWACLLFFGYGLTSAVNALTTIMAALGAISVGSAALLILELSDPYIGLLKVPLAGVERLLQALAPPDSAVIGHFPIPVGGP